MNGSDQLIHRFWFMVSTEQQWYGIIRECRVWFGKNWQGMPKVRRKLNKSRSPISQHASLPVWFDVPDPRFATWISVKHSLQVQSDAKYQTTK